MGGALRETETKAVFKASLVGTSKSLQYCCYNNQLLSDSGHSAVQNAETSKQVLYVVSGKSFRARFQRKRCLYALIATSQTEVCKCEIINHIQRAYWFHREMFGVFFTHVKYNKNVIKQLFYPWHTNPLFVSAAV